jgi:hypothetical protein
MLIHAPKVRSLEFDGFAFMSLQSLRVTQMEDFPSLERLLFMDLNSYIFTRLYDAESTAYVSFLLHRVHPNRYERRGVYIEGPAFPLTVHGDARSVCLGLTQPLRQHPGGEK